MTWGNLLKRVYDYYDSDPTGVLVPEAIGKKMGQFAPYDYIKDGYNKWETIAERMQTAVMAMMLVAFMVVTTW